MKQFLFIVGFVLLSINVFAQTKNNVTTHHANAPWAVVAGGSKGIGKGIAVALAKRGYNLVLIARGIDALMHTQDSLQSTFKVQVKILSQDLSKQDAPQHVYDFLVENQVPISVLCNVAGLGGDNDYLQLGEDSIRYMMRLNFENPVMLTQKLLPLIEPNAPAYILNVSSMAGMAPMPTKNIYSSTKAAVISFSYNLRYQLKAKKISVSVLAPGPVYTKPQIIKTTRERLGKFGDWMALKPEFVGEITVERLFKKRMMIVPGTLSGISSVFIRVLPKRWAAAIYFELGK